MNFARHTDEQMASLVKGLKPTSANHEHVCRATHARILLLSQDKQRIVTAAQNLVNVIEGEAGDLQLEGNLNAARKLLDLIEDLRVALENST